jgi:phosphoribosylaminoimidazolecarboxamide formyltransferase/IMP cyclohydrolase
MKRALISVYDKTGIVDFAKGLESLGWEIVSTGGTYRLLKENGVEAVEIDQVTGFPEILDGRVKTLNPLIHGGILFRRDLDSHRSVVDSMGIVPIDIVINNLYPFEETVSRADATQNEIIENIDIGGPSMIRAAAKNYRDVTVIVDPADYGTVLAELRMNGVTTLETRTALARKAFSLTAFYDALIAGYFNESQGVSFPELLALPYRKRDSLRYGENPHQRAAFYIESNKLSGTIAGAKQLHGKALSFNNINDANGAIALIKEFDEPAAVAIKHANPCGVGSALTLLEAFEKAYSADPESIFGGIVALNGEVTVQIAEKLKEIFLEIIIAPSFSNEALDILTTKKNLRLLAVEGLMNAEPRRLQLKQVQGGLLLQDSNQQLLGEEMPSVTKRFPDDSEIEDLLFAWKVAKHISSNGVVLAKNKMTVGIGLGEVNRFWAVEEAIKRSGDRAPGSVLASDGFFPFRDSLKALAAAGVTAVIQPGGSVKDEEVIEEADENGIAMLFTGIRHFRH